MADACCICLGVKGAALCDIRPCAHSVCRDCGLRLVQRSVFTCPMCRQVVSCYSFPPVVPPLAAPAAAETRRYHEPSSSDESDYDDAGYSRNDFFGPSDDDEDVPMSF